MEQRVELVQPQLITDHIGCPLKDAIVFVENALVGANLRDRVKIGASGRLFQPLILHIYVHWYRLGKYGKSHYVFNRLYSV